MQMNKKLTILDVDTGIDDALAIAYAVHSSELELVAITTTYGNVTADEALRNTAIVLEKLGNTTLPVYRGAEGPLYRQKKRFARHVHGENGIGNVTADEPNRLYAEQHAADFIIEQARSYPGEITLITVGPLTNLAIALQKEPELGSLLKQVITMGGAVRVPGNVNPAAEANIFSDPDAAALVFKSGLPLTLVGLDVTLATLLPSAEVEKWRVTHPGVGEFFADMVEFYINYYKSGYPDITGCALHDPLAVGVAVDATFVTSIPLHIVVGTEGEDNARTIEVLDGEPNCHVCVEVQAERFLQHFLSKVLG